MGVVTMTTSEKPKRWTLEADGRLWDHSDQQPGEPPLLVAVCETTTPKLLRALVDAANRGEVAERLAGALAETLDALAVAYPDKLKSGAVVPHPAVVNARAALDAAKVAGVKVES